MQELEIKHVTHCLRSQTTLFIDLPEFIYIHKFCEIVCKKTYKNNL